MKLLAGLALGAAAFAAGAAATAVRVDAGGALTMAVDNRDAFARPAPQLDAAELRRFQFGNRLFNTNWTTAPSSVPAFDGLGPTFNRVSCSGCHVRDGRGRPPVEGEQGFDSMLFRVSIAGAGEHGGPRAHPGYGDQINDRAIPGVPPEARVSLSWEPIAGRYGDGERYELLRPRVRLHDLKFGALGTDGMISPRVAPAVIGMGLIDAIADADLLAAADPDDRDGDGISGRVNRVWDAPSQRQALGRFGWKSNVATLLAQTVGAAHGDIGLSSAWFRDENCPAPQRACAAAPRAEDLDLSAAFVEKLVAYLETLAVPARRQADTPKVLQGERRFTALGCAACHTPVQRTAAVTANPRLGNQTFMPFSDFLLHDMGDALADGRPDFQASGSEWRTAPLWGLGLLPTVNGHQRLLHDGRARGFAEAILWHGGEAQAAADAFRAESRADREALLAYLASL